MYNNECEINNGYKNQSQYIDSQRIVNILANNKRMYSNY